MATKGEQISIGEWSGANEGERGRMAGEVDAARAEACAVGGSAHVRRLQVAGVAAFAAGAKRITPGGLASFEAREWLAGWDRANLAAPVPGCPEMDETFGPVIASYSRAQAIEDGVLVDLSKAAPDVCRQHYKVPVAVTAEVWAIIEKALASPRHCNDLNGVVHDLLWMSKKGITKRFDASTHLFRVIITGGARRTHTFKAVCGPGDDAEPVITISGETED